MTTEFLQGDPDEADAAIKVIEESGDREKALEMKLARAERARKRDREALQALQLQSVKESLLKEFDYVTDPDLIVGTTEKEMRASAERIQAAVAKAIEAKGLVKGVATPNADDPRKAEWGAPPPVATETISEAPMAWEEITGAAISGKRSDGTPMSRNEIINDIKANGPREISRPSIAGAAIATRRAASK